MSLSFIENDLSAPKELEFPDNIINEFKELLEAQSFVRIVFGETVEAMCIAIALSKLLSSKGIPHVVEPSDYSFFYSLLKEKKEQRLIMIQALELTPVLEEFKDSYDFALLIDNYEVLFSDDNVMKKVNQIFLNGLLEHISLTELVYYFLKRIFPSEINNDVLKLLVTGFVGSWDKNDYKQKEDRDLLSECKNIKVFQGLKIPGRRSLPIHLSLALMVDPVVLGITGDEGAALDLLISSNVPTLEGDRQRTPSDLSFEESRSLFSNMIVEFTNKYQDKTPPEIIGPIVEFEDEQDPSLIDAREFYLMLFALINSKAYDVALPLCLGSKSELTIAEKILAEYRRMLLDKYAEIISLIEQGPDSHFVYDMRHLISWHLSKAVMKIFEAKEKVSTPRPAIMLFKGKDSTVIVGVHLPKGVKQVFPWDKFWEKIGSPHILDIEVNSHNIFLETNSSYLNEYLEKLFDVLEPYFNLKGENDESSK